MDIRWLERVTQRVHRHHWSHTCCIAIVILELTASELWTRGRLNSHYTGLLTLAQIATDKWEADTSEVGATAEATDNNIRLVARHLHLTNSLLADDGLVQQNVVHHTTQTVTGAVTVLQSTLHSLRNGNTQISRTIRICRQNIATALGCCAWRRDNIRTPRIHQQLAVRLLLTAHLHHIYSQIEVEILARQRHSTTPLTTTSLGCEVLYTLLGVVVRLWNSGIGLVRSCGRNTLILKVNLRWGVEHTLKVVGTHNGRRTPNLVELLHLLWNLDITLL